MSAISREEALSQDQQDPLRAYRDQFELAEGLIYLDGNSLGPLPKKTVARLDKGVRQEWGQDLITSWNKHGWMHLPQKLGEKIAPMIGAGPSQVVAADSTSVNTFKLIAAALQMQPGRRVILSDPGNFPTDLYMVQGLTEMLGPDRCELRLVNEDEVVDAIDEDTALVMLTHVNFRSGRKYDMQAVTKAAHAKGALMLWDLAHSAGALPVELDRCNVDLAVGCTYKYLNSGPGGPAFLYVAKRHQDKAIQPLTGWHGHASPFEFDTKYEPSATVDRYLCGTPSVLAMLALDESLDIWATVDMGQVREKSKQLCDLFIQLVEELCAGHGFELASPRNADQRGSQVSFAHEEGYAIMQALIADQVIGDFRAPNLIRFGFTPLYTSFTDVWDAVERLRVIMEEGRHKKAEFQVRAAVT